MDSNSFYLPTEPDPEPEDDARSIADAVRSAKTLAPGRREFRLGRIAISYTAAAWTVSILVHAGVALGAFLVWRAYRPVSELKIDGGSGGSVTLSGNNGSPILQTRLPAFADLPPQVSYESPADAGADASEDADDGSWRGHATLSNLVDEADDAILVPGSGGSGGSADLPTPRRAGAKGDAIAPTRHAASGSAGSGAASGRSVPANGGSGGSFAPPGLPGELSAGGVPGAEYPAEARQRGQQGVVRVEVMILPDGSVGATRVVSDPGFPLLREAALRAADRLRAYRFPPARLDGRPVACPVVIPYNFVLR